MMKIIAHRGGKVGKENSLEAFLAAIDMGADLVECDVRKTKDGAYVIFHDKGFKRLANSAAAVTDVTLGEMTEILEKSGRTVLTFDELAADYHEATPILLHIKTAEADETLARRIADSGLPIVVGVSSLEMLHCMAKYLPPERILAFMESHDLAKAYYDGGAGIIRLWENWLDRITPAEVKAICPNAKVFIMACRIDWKDTKEIALSDMDGSGESLDKCLALGADGVLMNDMQIALTWRK